MTEPKPHETYNVPGADMSDLEAAFVTRWHQLAPGAPEPEREVRFRADRKWRWDFAWPGRKVAVELQGGTWTRGRHVRGGGYRDDCEKMLAGVAAGWRVVWVTADMLRDIPTAVIGMIRGMVEQGKEAGDDG